MSEIQKPVFITGPKLRQRWSDMCASVFYERLRNGKIPPAEYPFGDAKPYWRLSTIEEFERPPEPVAA